MRTAHHIFSRQYIQYCSYLLLKEGSTVESRCMKGKHRIQSWWQLSSFTTGATFDTDTVLVTSTWHRWHWEHAPRPVSAWVSGPDLSTKWNDIIWASREYLLHKPLSTSHPIKTTICYITSHRRSVVVLFPIIQPAKHSYKLLLNLSLNRNSIAEAQAVSHYFYKQIMSISEALHNAN